MIFLSKEHEKHNITLSDNIILELNKIKENELKNTQQKYLN